MLRLWVLGAPAAATHYRKSADRRRGRDAPPASPTFLEPPSQAALLCALSPTVVCSLKSVWFGVEC